MDINNIFITTETSGIQSLEFDFTRSWVNNLPAINVKSQSIVPENVYLRTLFYPSGVEVDDAFLSFILDPANESTYNNIYKSDEITVGSGYYLDYQLFDDSGIYDNTFVFNRSHENTYYDFGYYITYVNSFDEEESIFSAIVGSSGTFLTKAGLPDPGNIKINSRIFSDNVNYSRLYFTISQTSDLNNYNLSTPAPYVLAVSGVDGWMDSSGNNIGYWETTSNYFYQSTSGMFFDLPYISGSQPDANNYEFYLMYYDQEGGRTFPPMIFDTNNIRHTSDELDTGSLDGYNVNIRPLDVEVPIKNERLNKKRYSIGIEDIATISNTYTKQGIFISDFYPVDDPVYYFALRVKETFPQVSNINDYDMIKYYVQFQNQEWEQISPINRTEEFNDENKLVPKFIILDKLNIETLSSDLKELPLDFPVYSFRIRIEFDLSEIEGINNVSPSVSNYECLVADRQSYLRIE